MNEEDTSGIGSDSRDERSRTGGYGAAIIPLKTKTPSMRVASTASNVSGDRMDYFPFAFRSFIIA